MVGEDGDGVVLLLTDFWEFYQDFVNLNAGAR